MRIKYSINGIDFADSDIYVKESTGVVDLPKMKTPTSHSWSEYHGEIVDLSTYRVQPREITLKCAMTADNEFDFIQKIDVFNKTLMSKKLLSLRIDITGANAPLIYYVYVKDGVSVSKKWRAVNMYGEFTVKLIEPEPIKRVARVQSQNVTLNVRTDKAINIYWGDGSETFDVYGDTSVNHNYDDTEDRYIVITGVIEDIEQLTLNGATLVW